MSGAMIWLWNGSKWTESLCSDAGAARTVRATLPITVPRITSKGQISATPKTLYWIHVNPSAASWILELMDDLDGESDPRIDWFGTSRESHHMNFDPPIPFDTGVYCKVLTNLTSIVLGYE